MTTTEALGVQPQAPSAAQLRSFALLSILYAALTIALIPLVAETGVTDPKIVLVYGIGILVADRMLNASRHLHILISFPENLFKIGKTWLLLLPVGFSLLGKSKDLKNMGTGLRTVLLTLVIMTAGYYGVYTITPHDLDWHLRTSLWRLVVQLWPAVLFLCFYWMNTSVLPGEAASQNVFPKSETSVPKTPKGREISPPSG